MIPDDALTLCGRFSLPILGGILMWNLITHFLTFTGGMTAGVVLMCLLQTGKQADEEFEEMQRRNQGNEHGL